MAKKKIIIFRNRQMKIVHNPVYKNNHLYIESN